MKVDRMFVLQKHGVAASEEITLAGPPEEGQLRTKIIQETALLGRPHILH